MESDKEITREEIKKEFQLERMILFSDAVFAIVITLMAIEIRLPESDSKLTLKELPTILHHLLPVILAYMVSFMFIGTIWYQHLKIFGLLKDYDKGLVVRNLILLFFVGLFPFSASVITRSRGDMPFFFMYMAVILSCLLAQYRLQYYIIVKRPELRINTEMDVHVFELRKRKIALIGFVAAAVMIVATYTLIPDPDLKPMATFWMMLVPVIYKFFSKKKK
jgi:uncharacterized membrane protein